MHTLPSLAHLKSLASSAQCVTYSLLGFAGHALLPPATASVRKACYAADTRANISTSSLTGRFRSRVLRPADHHVHIHGHAPCQYFLPSKSSKTANIFLAMWLEQERSNGSKLASVVGRWTWCSHDEHDGGEEKAGRGALSGVIATAWWGKKKSRFSWSRSYETGTAAAKLNTFLSFIHSSGLSRPLMSLWIVWSMWCSQLTEDWDILQFLEIPKDIKIV